MITKRKLSTLAAVGAAVTCAVFALAASATSFASPRTSKFQMNHMVRTPGGTLTIAEAAGNGPSYIFPMMGAADFLQVNFQLIYLLYRPLYWFGTGDTPALNEGLSLAAPPAYTNNHRTVTVKMKGYKWSNGETVSASDVVFWMNMLKADATSWGGYEPGPDQFPGDVTNVSANERTDTVTFTLDQAYGSYWFTYNELSQVTPLPIAWDVTSAGAPAGSGHCSSASYTSITTSLSSRGVVTPVSASAKACAKVYGFLTGEREAADLGTYATNPLWKIVDGPFTLSTYDATDSAATVVPNLTYSGPVKSSLAKLVMVPFTTAASEYTALVDGTTINIGYVSPQDLPTYKGEAFNKNGQPLVGKNDPSLASRYSLDPVYPWGINYFALNYTNPTSGPIFKQLYVRQAMQSLMNQTAWIQAFDAGYGAPTYGPVPSLPPTDMATKREGSNPYPYNPSHARNLLRSHGWSVVPGGVTTCIRPGTARERCGAGIPRGATLSLNYLYYEGSTSFDDQITALKASWSQAGIRLNLEGSKSFQSVILTAAAPCTTGKACAWEIANWEGGWIYVPDYYPTGEQLFDSSAGSNFGEYSDPTADGLIRLTTSSSSLKALYNYEDYVARQLPVVWQPEMAMELNEVSKNVCGVTPEDSVFGWEAENWYFCKPAK